MTAITSSDITAQQIYLSADAALILYTALEKYPKGFNINDPQPPYAWHGRVDAFLADLNQEVWIGIGSCTVPIAQHYSVQYLQTGEFQIVRTSDDPMSAKTNLEDFIGTYVTRIAQD